PSLGRAASREGGLHSFLGAAIPKKGATASSDMEPSPSRTDGKLRCPAPQPLPREGGEEGRGPARIDRDRGVVVVGGTFEERPVGSIVEAAVDPPIDRRGVPG